MFDNFAKSRNNPAIMQAAVVSPPVVQKQPITADQVFKALGHPARTAIVKKLETGDQCVCELLKDLGLGWSSVSRHLSVLKEAGVVTDERRGMQIFYHLNLTCVTRFIHCLESPNFNHSELPCCPLDNQTPADSRN